MNLLRGVVWHRILDGASMETAWLEQQPHGFLLRGTIACAEEGEPLALTYRLQCDTLWRSLAVELRQVHAGRERSLLIEHEGEWRVDGVLRPELSGCTDLDLSLSPATNALPINRLGLDVGAAVEIRAAWVLFPRLEVVPARQRYTRVAERTYRFEGLDSDFTASLQVDDLGLPLDYEGNWKRIATWR
jgi:uncharacterized protein